MQHLGARHAEPGTNGKVVANEFADEMQKRLHPVRAPLDLVGARLIQDTAQPQAWRVWLAAQGVARSDTAGDLWFDSAPATLHAAEQGLGIALAIDPLVRAWPGFGTGLTYVLPQASGPRTRYWMVRRPESDRDPRIRAFETWLRESCQGLGALT